MAKNIYNNETFLRGRNGKNVYRVWQGRQVVSTFVPPANPNTEPQQYVRAKMKKLGGLASRFRYANRLGLRAYARKTDSTVVGTFVELNMEALGGSMAQSLSIDPTKLKMSAGGALPVDFGESVTVSDNTASVGIDYSYADDFEGIGEDKVYLVAYCPDHNMTVTGAGVSRAAARAQVHIPNTWSGMDVHFYGFVVSADGHDASETVYICRKTLS